MRVELGGEECDSVVEDDLWTLPGGVMWCLETLL